jgi:DNA-binding HxlR family transcriptional regulator
MKQTFITMYSDCPNKHTKSIIGSRWKPVIIYVLRDRKLRFGQLQAIIGKISTKVFTQCLKELEADDIILREEFAETPVRVEYSLKENGVALVPLIKALAEWEYKNYTVKLQ